MTIFPRDLVRKKQAKEVIVAVTAYDYPTAMLVDQAGVDLVLVGDSLGTVIQGEETTLSVTLEQMIYHARLVRRGVKRALLAVDLPFLSYQPSVEEAIRSAGRVLKETGAAAVKLEGGEVLVPVIERLLEVGIPVIGHLGLTPQSFHALGGYRVQGRSETEADALMRSAIALEGAGVSAIVLEGVPETLAREISESLRIPTIGIGAGRHCDGQILVLHDLLGLAPDYEARYPRFVRRYRELSQEIRHAVSEYAEDVRNRRFPGPDNVY